MQETVYCVEVALAVIMGSCRAYVPEGHLSLIIIQKLIHKLKIFTKTPTQGSFWVCDFSYYDLAEKKFCLDSVLFLS